MKVMLILLVGFLSLLSLNACNRIASTATSEETPDWKNVSQFQSLSPAGSESIWVVTVRGQLLRISKQGEQRQVNDAGTVSVVSFIDSARGWVVDRNSQTWSTSDGGGSWELISRPPPGSRGFYLPKQLTFIDELHAWLIGISQVWRTEDGGRTWQERFSISNTTPQRVGRLYRGAFVGTESGWVTSSGGVVIYTRDGGVTWKTATPVPERADLHDVFFSDEQTGWLIGRPEGGVLRTDDGGKTSKNALTNDNGRYFNSIYFPTKDEGWVVGWRVIGDKHQEREGVVFHTLDGGKNWRSVSAPGRERFFDRVLFSDVYHGWLIGRDALYYTTDAGTGWSVVLKLSPIENSHSD